MLINILKHEKKAKNMQRLLNSSLSIAAMRILSLDSESWAKMGSNDTKHDLHMCTKHISDICLKRNRKHKNRQISALKRPETRSAPPTLPLPF